MDENCRHCGARGTVKRTDSVVIKKVDEVIYNGTAEDTISTYVDVWVCSSCDQPTIWRHMWSEIRSDPEDEPAGLRLLYPSTRDNSALPEKVRMRLESAARAKGLDADFYAVGMRRMLEAICADQGAEGDDLFDKLKDLGDRGLIPGVLADAGHQLRMFGNLGAHDHAVSVEAADIEFIEDLADALLDYLYRAPAKVETVRSLLAAKKT